MKAASILVSLALSAPLTAAPAATMSPLKVPIESRKLANGLTVVVSENHDSTAVGLCVLYRIGSRLEPRGRSGFAHLFEHLMFEGTPAAPKGVFDRVCDGSGGNNNGQTRPDTTIYIENFPSSALDRFLWLEADRLKGLAFATETLQNQREVVKEEIRVNVQNDPYGVFEEFELPGKLFDKWENGHDAYGDFKDLEAASLPDVKGFFSTYYRPNNAILVVAGDVSAGDVFAKVERLFGAIPAGELPARPDLAEPKRTKPVLVVEKAPLAKTPALAAAWRMPPPGHADVFPLLVLGELLHDGRTGRLYRGLVEGRELATDISGGFNPAQGNAWYDGTTMFLSKISYRRGVPHEKVLAALEAEIGAIASNGVPAAELTRVKTKLLAGFYASIEGRLDLAVGLAHSVAFDGRPEALLEFPDRVERVTPADLKRAAGAWLTGGARAVIVKLPGEDQKAETR